MEAVETLYNVSDVAGCCVSYVWLYMWLGEWEDHF